MAARATTKATHALLEHVSTWIEPVDSVSSHWMFRFDGQPNTILYYLVMTIDLPAEHVGPYYVVKVRDSDSGKVHGWPLTNLDYTIRDRTVLVSDEVYADRLVAMWRQLALKALQALILAETEPPQEGQQEG